jgi:hypothetical protein
MRSLLESLARPAVAGLLLTACPAPSPTTPAAPEPAPSSRPAADRATPASAVAKPSGVETAVRADGELDCPVLLAETEVLELCGAAARAADAQDAKLAPKRCSRVFTGANGEVSVHVDWTHDAEAVRSAFTTLAEVRAPMTGYRTLDGVGEGARYYSAEVKPGYVIHFVEMFRGRYDASMQARGELCTPEQFQALAARVAGRL